MMTEGIIQGFKLQWSNLGSHCGCAHLYKESLMQNMVLRMPLVNHPTGK